MRMGKVLKASLGVGSQEMDQEVRVKEPLFLVKASIGPLTSLLLTRLTGKVFWQV